MFLLRIPGISLMCEHLEVILERFMSFNIMKILSLRYPHRPRIEKRELPRRERHTISIIIIIEVIAENYFGTYHSVALQVGLGFPL